MVYAWFVNNTQWVNILLLTAKDYHIYYNWLGVVVVVLEKNRSVKWARYKVHTTHSINIGSVKYLPSEYLINIWIKN